MPTQNQLALRGRKKKRRKTRVVKLRKCPQRKGIVVKLLILSPKKPNSANRKIARVRLTDGTILRAGIPGQGHNLQQYSTVLVRGGRVKDVPGINYKLMRGQYDFSTVEKFQRKKARSKWGLPPVK